MTYNFRIKQKKITNDILHLEFPNMFALTMTFLRPQEFYENPYFIRKKGFTIEDYMDWEFKTEGRFEYTETIEGCNVPRDIFLPFFDGEFNPLTKKEKKLLRKIKPYMNNDKLYVIGTYRDGSANILKHEIGHGLFGTNSRYRKNVESILSDISRNEKRKLNSFLDYHGYDKSVRIDEMHAYVMADIHHLKLEEIISDNLTEVSRRLNTNFNRFINIHAFI